MFGRTNLSNFDQNKDIYFSGGLTEIVHNGSLICDDLEDQSLKRRGDLCTYKKFGVDYALNAGNFMAFGPLNRIQEFVPQEKQLEVFKIYGQELANIHVG